MISLGGFGLWWAYDIVALGTGNINAASYRLQVTPYDVLTRVGTLFVFFVGGFLFAFWKTMRFLKRKRLGIRNFIPRNKKPEDFKPTDSDFNEFARIKEGERREEEEDGGVTSV